MNRRRLLKTLGLSSLAATASTGRSEAGVGADPYYQGPPSDHFDGTRFFNPGGEEPRGLSDLLRWQFGGNRSRWPRRWPEEPVQTVPAPRVAGRTLRATMIGHATVLLQTDGLNILTDPVYSHRASPTALAGPRRVNPPGVAFESLPPIDLVLVSHNHYDHLDVDTLARLKVVHDPLVVTPLGNDAIIRSRVPTMRIETLDWGGSVRLPGATIRCEPAHHWSARSLGDRRMALWASFVVETEAGRIYHVGDTGFHDGINYRDAGARYGGFRLAMLPIGAYEPRWFMRAQHQDPAEAVQGMRLAGAAHALAHHWGTFQLTDEAIGAPPAELRAALEREGLDAARFRALPPGTSWDVPDEHGLA